MRWKTPEVERKEGAIVPPPVSPEVTVANEYLEKLRSIGTLSEDRKTQTRQYVHDGDRSGSYQTEHWDGRESVSIRAEGIRVTEETLGFEKGEGREFLRDHGKG